MSSVFASPRVISAPHDVQECASVEIPDTGAHDQSLDRRETHARIDRIAAVNSRNRSAVPEVAGDHLQLFDRLARHLGGTAADVEMAGAVETVAADVVATVEQVRQTVEVGEIRQCAVEGCVEHTHHGCLLHQTLAGDDSLDVRRVVQRRKIDRIVEDVHHFLVDLHRAGEGFATVDDTVPNSVNLATVFDDTVVWAEQNRKDVLDGGGVINDFTRDLHLVAVVTLLLEDCALHPDPLNAPLREHLVLAAVDLKELVLDRAAAAIQC